MNKQTAKPHRLTPSHNNDMVHSINHPTMQASTLYKDNAPPDTHQEQRLSKRDTRQDILLTARAMLQTRSFNAFSFQDIAEHIGIRKASVHHHFNNKEALGLALVDHYIQRFQYWANKLQAQQLSSADQLDAYLDSYRKILAEDGHKICPNGILGAEFNTLPPLMQARLQDLLTTHQQWLCQRLKQLAPNTTSDALSSEAHFIHAALQGALQIARVTQNQQALEDAIDHLQQRFITGGG